MVHLKTKISSALQKINNSVNLMHMIDVLEKKQELAEYMETMNTENAEEQERKRLCREATAACLKEIHEHCTRFLDQNSKDASYEEWIKECHPENAELGYVDHRFYVRDSDHRIIWNSYCDMNGCPERKVRFTEEES